MEKIKTIIVGDTGVGKSNIIVRIHQNIFKGDLASTCGVQYNASTYNIQGKKLQVELWDTAGQERYKKIVSNFFRGADGVILVADITSEKSLKQLQFWAQELSAHLSQQVPKILLLNKTDISTELQPQHKEIVENICQQYKLTTFKVSAKTGSNIKLAYSTLVEQAYKYASKNQQQNPNKSSVLNINAPKKKKKCC